MKFAIVNCLDSFGEMPILDGRKMYPPTTKLVEAANPREAVAKGLRSYVHGSHPTTTFVKDKAWQWGVYPRKDAATAKKNGQGWVYLSVLVLAIE
jgi:hypothetical protein